MNDIVDEMQALKNELMRMKSKDKARPMIADVPMSGSYRVPGLGDGQAIIVTVRSELRDWPQFSVDAYDLQHSQKIDPPPIYRITVNRLSDVNKFAIAIGRVLANTIRLDWVVLSQSGQSVSFEVR